MQLQEVVCRTRFLFKIKLNARDAATKVSNLSFSGFYLESNYDSNKPAGHAASMGHYYPAKLYHPSKRNPSSVPLVHWDDEMWTAHQWITKEWAEVSQDTLLFYLSRQFGLAHEKTWFLRNKSQHLRVFGGFIQPRLRSASVYRVRGWRKMSHSKFILFPANSIMKRVGYYWCWQQYIKLAENRHRK